MNCRVNQCFPRTRHARSMRVRHGVEMSRDDHMRGRMCDEVCDSIRDTSNVTAADSACILQHHTITNSWFHHTGSKRFVILFN